MAVLPALAVCLCAGQDRSDWQALAALRPGDEVRVSVRSQKPVTGTFQAWNADQVTVASVATKRADVLKLERRRIGGWSRGKTAAVGALIGGGAGVGIGAAAGGCKGFGICISRGTAAALVGASGAAVGAIIGALVPHHRMDTIYEAR
jgi:hypothetical protein